MMREERASDVVRLRANVPRKFCADVDALKAEEWKRRRLLRLEQVRQQSKDIASDIRRKVYVEKNCLLKNLQKTNEVAITQWKEVKLNALQNELSEVLNCVGSAHKEAEFQEAHQELKADHLQAADRRGREAILRLRLEEQARKHAEESRKLQRQHVRSIEGARSAVLVSLPAPKSTLPAGDAHKPKIEVDQKKNSREPSVKQWPSKTWSVSIPLGVTPTDINDNSSHRVSSPAKSSTTSIRKVNSHTSLLCEENEETISIVPSERHGISSCNTHFKGSSCENIALEPVKKNAETAKIKQGPKDVELYDCSNGCHVQYSKPSAVCTSVPAGPIDGLEAAESCVSASNMKKDTSHAPDLKRIERGKEAMKRVQTRREHQALLSDLAKLVRQEAALRSFLPSKAKTHSKSQEEYCADFNGLQKEAFEDDIVTEYTEPKETGETVGLETSTAVDEIIIDSCSQNEANQPLKDGFLKEDRALGERIVTVPEKEIKSAQEERVDRAGRRRDASISAAKSSGKEPSSEKEGRSFSFDETTLSTSTSVDAPVLNLALWTSRSPSYPDREDKTLTPSDKTLTPSEIGEEERDSSMNGHVPKAEPRSASSAEPSLETHLRQRIHLPEKSRLFQRERTKKVVSQKHLGAGDNVAIQAQKKRRSSEKKSSEVTGKVKSAFPDGSRVPRPQEEKKTLEKNSPETAPNEKSAYYEGESFPAVDKSVGRKKKDSPLSSESTSYMSLPNKILSALTEDLRSLLSLTRGQKGGTTHSDPLLAHYINRLLDMSRQSVERLNVITSEVCTPPSALFRTSLQGSSSTRSSSQPRLSGLDETDCPSNLANLSSASIDSLSSGDNSAVARVMQQCCARIFSLSQMIELVRQQKLVSTPVPSSRSSSLHLDSTAYLNPPSTAVASSKIAPRTADVAEKSNVVDDTYSATITRLISEIREQLTKHTENPLEIPLCPVQSSTENMKSSRSNELSTIPEQDLSFVEWPSVVISSETCGSSEDVEREFSRMGLGWAGTTLRKTKEACTLDSNSSSDVLEFSALSLFGSYSHSTPIKMTEGAKHFNS